MKMREIEHNGIYSNGKTARIVLSVWKPMEFGLRLSPAANEITYLEIGPAGVLTGYCNLKTFARWALYPCEVEIQVDGARPWTCFPGVSDLHVGRKLMKRPKYSRGAVRALQGETK